MASPQPPQGYKPSPLDTEMSEQELLAMYDKYARGEIPRYKDHLSDDADKFFEDMEKVPLFMTKSPDSINSEDAPALAALQSIIYEDSTPENRANYHKEVGNEEFKKGKAHYKMALKCYDDGLKENCGVASVEAALYSNRAMVQLNLGNYRSCVDDCKEARKRDPSAIKVYYRAAKALSAVERYAEAVQWCDDGLAVDAANTSIQELRSSALKLKAAKEKKERAADAQRRKEKQATDALDSAIRARGIRLGNATANPAADVRGVVHNPTGTSVYIDADSVLHWPVCFLYPESGQSDFVADFNENTMISAQVDAVLAERPPWDEAGAYVSSTCDVFFEHFAEGSHDSVLVPVNRSATLREVLSDRRCVVSAHLPTFMIVPRASPFREKLVIAK
eukprot:Opistho-2@80713